MSNTMTLGQRILSSAQKEMVSERVKLALQSKADAVAWRALQKQTLAKEPPNGR